MLKKSLAIFITIIFVITSHSFVSAQDTTQAQANDEAVNAQDLEDEIKSDEETQNKNEEVNSFEVFWPMVAGKTRADRFYFLKRFKEKVRGALIFGDAKKADYRIFLAVKRTLEAEKLLTDGKDEDARVTLENALEEMDEAQEKVNEVSEKKGNFGESVHTMNSRLKNISELTTWLAKDHDEKLLFDVSQKASELSEKI